MENIVYTFTALLLFLGACIYLLSSRANKDMKAWELILVNKANEDEAVDTMEEGMYLTLVATRNHALELKKDCHNLKTENANLRNEVAYYRGLLGLNQSSQAV